MQQSSNYDIVVIGAGIQGAGVAQAAAVSGYKTLLIEKLPDAGMGTSCKSSKLIHGGLRYLESGQFGLVRECLNERKILLKNAADLVKLTPFFIPVYADSKRPAWLILLGLCIYSIFSLRSFSIISRQQWHLLDGIELKNLKYVFKYYDAQTDDQLLTRTVLNSAIKYGATVKFNSELIGSHYKNNLHRLSYLTDEITHQVNCKFIINCSGPWVDLIQQRITPELDIPDIELIAGTHIIVEGSLNKGAYYIEAADKRAVFVMPWKSKQILIGTTERLHSEPIERNAPTEDEINYLIKTYNRYFTKKISHENITDSFSGLRVLDAGNSSSFTRSRESMIIHNSDCPGLITLVGGKLTAYRISAERVISLIRKTLPAKSFLNTKSITLKTT